MPRGFTPPAECPVCGETVPRDARACPGCGADERSGWDEEAARYDGLDLPDEALVDGGPVSATKPKGSTALWTIVAVLLLVAIGLGLIFR